MDPIKLQGWLSNQSISVGRSKSFPFLYAHFPYLVNTHLRWCQWFHPQNSVSTSEWSHWKKTGRTGVHRLKLKCTLFSDHGCNMWSNNGYAICIVMRDVALLKERCVIVGFILTGPGVAGKCARRFVSGAYLNRDGVLFCASLRREPSSGNMTNSRKPE